MSRPERPRTMPIRLDSKVSADAKGSQAGLVVFGVIGGIVLLTGLIFLAAGISTAGYLAVAIGVLFFLGFYSMWHRSQRDVDRHRPPRADIVLSRDSIRMRASERFVSSPTTWQLVTQLMSRLSHQERLPPADGVIETVDGKEVVREFTSEEAAADAAALEERVLADRQRLADAMKPLFRVDLPEGKRVPALPREASGERSALAPDDEDSNPEVKRRSGKG